MDLIMSGGLLRKALRGIKELEEAEVA